MAEVELPGITLRGPRLGCITTLWR